MKFRNPQIPFGYNGAVRLLKNIAGAGVVSIVLAGCGVGSLMGGSADTTAQLAQTSPTAAQISQIQSTALPAIATQCPPIKVRRGGEAVFSYVNNRVGDAQALKYQAVIDGQSRNCIVSNGLITVKMGVVGRLILGPSNTQNDATLPVRFVVERNEIAVFSQLYDIPLTVTPPDRSAEFVKVVENVAIPYLGGENIIIWVGFDPRS
ncbi:MAG: hypothetical protein L3J13_10655 [Devosiaceae bacterium]|nr:hypothetical protein [Devosiaceae bacterium]